MAYGNRQTGASHTKTKFLIEEYIKCSNDTAYFMEKYCTVSYSDSVMSSAIALFTWQKMELFKYDLIRKLNPTQLLLPEHTTDNT